LTIKKERKMKKMWKIKMIAIVFAGVIALAAIVMWLWNWLVPDLFNGPMINFFQAIGLMLLSRILFRGFHKMGGCNGQPYGPWNNWKQKMENMSPEERERMRELWKKRCGGYNCDDDVKKTP
jgi:hypothetical protein